MRPVESVLERIASFYMSQMTKLPNKDREALTRSSRENVPNPATVAGIANTCR